MNKIVHKIGGGILKRGEGIEDVNKITDSYDVPQLIVVSALDDVTKKLRDYVRNGDSTNVRGVIGIYANAGRGWIRNSEYSMFAQKLREYENELFEGRLSDDEFLSFGERISTEFCYHALRAMGKDVGKISFDRKSPGSFPIVCSELSRDADPILEKTKSRFSLVRDEMEKHEITLLPGFIGVTESGELKTLGSGGSDMSAIVSAYALDVDEVNLWKETEGVRTANPDIVEKTRLIRYATYSEGDNITKFGGKVVQHKSSKLAEEKGIKIKVPYIKNPEIVSVIGGEKKEEHLTKYVGGTDTATLIRGSSDDILKIKEMCRKQNFQDDFFTLHEHSNKGRVMLLNSKNNLNYGKKVGVVALVGDRLKETEGVLERSAAQILKQKINILDYGSGGEEDSYMFFICDPNYTNNLINALHKDFIENDPSWRIV